MKLNEAVFTRKIILKLIFPCNSRYSDRMHELTHGLYTNHFQPLVYLPQFTKYDREKISKYYYVKLHLKLNSDLCETDLYEVKFS